MKIKALIKVSILVAGIGLLTACTNEDMQQKNETNQGGGHVVAIFTGHQPKADSSVTSRTTATHLKGHEAQVFWEATDKIWVKDIGGTFRQSNAATFPVGSNKRQANFGLASGNYGFNPEVRYTNTGNPNTVTIPNNQTQNGSEDFGHLGISGDCGTATAVGGGGDFEFTLQHKASYICFLPRNENKGVDPSKFKLVRIFIEADKPFNGTYDFSNGSLVGKTPTGGQLTGMLLGGANPPKLSSTQEGSDQSGLYYVIAPGTYNLKVNYWFLNPVTSEDISVRKEYHNFTFPEGKIVDITANITLPEQIYCMWDAKQDYWHGYESERPTINRFTPGATQGQHYPKNNTDQRWYHEGTGSITPTGLCKDCSNVNELCWYAAKGDPHWDTRQIVMVRNGRVQHFNISGIWLKKKATILRDNSDISESRFSGGYPGNDGIDHDWRTESVASFPWPSTSGTLPHGAPANTADYFFLPALGCYEEGWLEFFGEQGFYWSSNTWVGTMSYYLKFHDSYVGLNGDFMLRDIGMSVKKFE